MLFQRRRRHSVTRVEGALHHAAGDFFLRSAAALLLRLLLWPNSCWLMRSAGKPRVAIDLRRCLFALRPTRLGASSATAAAIRAFPDMLFQRLLWHSVTRAERALHHAAGDFCLRSTVVLLLVTSC
jgi:hypothetical protein